MQTTTIPIVYSNGCISNGFGFERWKYENYLNKIELIYNAERKTVLNNKNFEENKHILNKSKLLSLNKRQVISNWSRQYIMSCSSINPSEEIRKEDRADKYQEKCDS